VNSSGDHIRYVPGEFARAMVAGGSAEIANENGKVKSIKLLAAASTQAQRVGPASDASITGVRFTRWVRLDKSGTRVLEHHPRSRDYE
jgi:hypothetical protein